MSNALIPGTFGPKNEMYFNTMKYDTQSRACLLIINMIFEIVDLDPKLKTWADSSQNCKVHNFYEIWHSEQIEHSNYEYINWNWWP